jgi:hypothetical protein
MADRCQYVAFQQPDPPPPADQQPAVATDQEARAMQRLTGNLVAALEVWRDLNPTERGAERANYQGQARDAILQALRQDFLQGINDPARQWETIRGVLGRPRVLTILNQHLGNHGFEATVEGNALVFHRQNGQRNMLRVDLSTAPAEGGGAQALRPDEHDLRFARRLHQLYTLQWIFEPANLARIVQNNFREGWGENARPASLERLRTALRPYALDARIEIVDPADGANGWQLVIESTVDRDDNGRPRVRGRARPRAGQLIFMPEHEAVANHPQDVDRLARFIQRVVGDGGALRPEQQTWLFMAFMDLETPAGLTPQERTRRVTARDNLITALNRSLQPQGLRVGYTENHEGAPALEVYDLNNIVRNQAGEIAPNHYLRLRPAVLPHELLNTRQERSLIGDALLLIAPVAGAGVYALTRAIIANGPLESGRNLGALLRRAPRFVGYEVPRYIGYEMWTTRGPERPILRVERGSDTAREGTGGAALSEQGVRLADAPIYIEYNGARIAVSPEERVELGRRAIRESERQVREQIDAIRNDTSISDTERTRRLAEAQTRLRRIGETRPEDVRIMFEPGTRRISGFRIGVGVVLSVAAAAAIIAAWYAASHNHQPQRVQPFR